MPVFTAIAAGVTALATAVGFGAATAAAIGAFAVRTLVTVAISSLVANRANKKAAGAQDIGARVQLGPATNNKLPASYGSAFLAPTMLVNAAPLPMKLLAATLPVYVGKKEATLAFE